MQTLHAAAALLAAADSLDRLAPIAAALGFDAPARLDDDTRRALGLTDSILDARIASGRGALRALLVELAAGSAMRDRLPKIAARLSARAPHVLWLVLAVQRETNHAAIFAWTDDRRPPRVVALIANREQLVDSDAETLRSLAAAAAGNARDLLVHARWVEVLGRGALTRRFYRALESSVRNLAESSMIGDADTRHELALLDTSRLLFLAFLEAKGWLDRDRTFLADQFERCAEAGGGFRKRILRPLFFGTLNTPIRQRAPRAAQFGAIPFLNGGLFARTALERRHHDAAFSDDAYGALLFDVFAQYRFTAREESATWSEAAVDPEMLGHAFESLMAARERKQTGAFFTPFTLVERVTSGALDAALDVKDPAELRRRIERLSILDPACGSGAFLVHALDRVGALYRELGDRRDMGAIRRDVLARSIFGVDLNPTAVWLCQLRLWLAVVIESEIDDPSDVLPLPNLDRNVRVGDALAGRGFEDATVVTGGATLRRLRERYARANGARKEVLARQLDRVERERALRQLAHEIDVLSARRRDMLIARRGRDLFGDRYRPSREERVAADLIRDRVRALRASHRRIQRGGALPFSFAVHFADVAARGGFGIVLGNPPWVRAHHVPLADRERFRREFEVARVAAWEPGATPAGAGRGFAAQVDLAAIFLERSIRLAAPGSAIALLLPVKLWQSLAGGGARRIVCEETLPLRLEDHSEAPSAFDAAVYPSVLVARRLPSADASVAVTSHHCGTAPVRWRCRFASIPFDDSPGAPWLMLPPGVRRAFDRLRAAGRPLTESAIGRPHLGVKCGCNGAFIVRVLDVDDELAIIEGADGRRGTIERALLRPLVRGEHLARWARPDTTEYIVWTHDRSGAPLAELPPHAARWLARWRHALVSRTDARHRARWWSLFRTESARSDCPRVLWGDLGREPRAVVLATGDPTVPLNSCYAARCRDEGDAFALAALLNGPVARAWLNAIAEPARGGYRRYFGWTLSLLPLPADWSRARDVLAPVGRDASRCPPSDHDLLDASLEAYGLEHDDVAPLIVWMLG